MRVPWLNYLTIGRERDIPLPDPRIRRAAQLWYASSHRAPASRTGRFALEISPLPLLDRTATRCLENGGRDSVMTTLREVRAERLLSIRELARAASVAPSTIHLIESGRSTPQPRVVRCLAAALGVEPHEIDEFRRVIEATKDPTQRLHRAARAIGTIGVADRARPAMGVPAIPQTG